MWQAPSKPPIQKLLNNGEGGEDEDEEGEENEDEEDDDEADGTRDTSFKV